eukprot:1184777-Prorocentrum_minimum.AAC.2
MYASRRVFVRFDRNKEKVLNYDEVEEFIAAFASFDAPSFELKRYTGLIVLIARALLRQCCMLASAQVTGDDVDWFMKEMDIDTNGLISKDELVHGIGRWMYDEGLLEERFSRTLESLSLGLSMGSDADDFRDRPL